MKSPEEIKEGLKKCLAVVNCNHVCPYAELGSDNCIDELQKDVTEYVDNLEERVAIMTDRPIAHWMDEEDCTLVKYDEQGYIHGNHANCVTCSNCLTNLVGSDEYYCYGRFCPSCGAEMINKE